MNVVWSGPGLKIVAIGKIIMATLPQCYRQLMEDGLFSDANANACLSNTK